MKKFTLDAGWRWKPKRWWACLIAFWLVSSLGTIPFVIVPFSKEANTLTMLVMYIVVIFTTVTDREWPTSKKIGWFLAIYIIYQVVDLPFYLILGALLGVVPHMDSLEVLVRSLLFLTIAMRRSKFFVEPVSNSIIDSTARENVTLAVK